MFYEVLPTKIFRSNSSSLTYFDDKKLNIFPGSIVLIPLGKIFCPGIVLKRTKKPDFPCKSITKLIYEAPLPLHLVKSIFWLSSYYLSPLPTYASLVLPLGVEKSRRNPKKPTLHFSPTQKNPLSFSKVPLTQAQLTALSDLKAIKTPTRLLYGITGSGKTNLYLKLTQEAVKNQQSIILLVPEIALTSQLVEIFEQSFPERIILLHSRQTESERHILWESILNSTEPLIIIGPRSAIFAPLKNLGLIIVDESHESAYYQDNSPHYSALRLASFIAKNLNIPCIFGSATPLVTDFFIAKTKSSLASLTQKAKSSAIEPKIKIIDLSSRENFTKNRYFSNSLLETIDYNLEHHYQTLIYHNRRGSAPLTICESCGWQALCPNCFLPTTLHSDSYSLICHTCGFIQKLPSSCPECGSPSILHKGFGTKLLETELNKLFPKANIIRFDADNKKSDSLDKKFNEIKSGAFDIIIGTQTVSRGLDLPLLASIGIVQADAGLSLPDFSAEEKTFELLTQVIGRVGRGHLSTASVIIQTFRPNDPVISFAKTSDYLGFYQYLIKKRRKQSLPPFTYLAKIFVTYKTEKTTINKIRTVSRNLNKIIIQNSLTTSLAVSPPTPCFHERTSSGFSWQIILKAKNRSALVKALTLLDPRLSVHISLDPPSLL